MTRIAMKIQLDNYKSLLGVFPQEKEEVFLNFSGSVITLQSLPAFIYGVFVGARMTEGLHYTKSGFDINFIEPIDQQDVSISYNFF
jgi:hypothetical protein